MHASINRPLPHSIRVSRESQALWINISLSALMLVFIVVLFHPVFEWAWRQVARQDRQYHILVSILFVGLCAFRLYQEKHSLHFARPNTFATLLVFAVCAGYLFNQFFLHLNAVSVALFLLFCFALLGHFVSAAAWRSCLQPMLLAMLVLPFEGYLDIFLGFPMRLLSAEVAVGVLHGLKIASVSSDTVLLVDNRAAIVDIDCSGIKGFWLGSVFFCAITWIERYRLNLRWFLIAVLALGLLFAGNVVRIVALVVLDLVLDKATLAQILHESLGLISFTAVLFLSWQLLRLFGSRVEHAQCIASSNSKQIHCANISMTTCILLVLLSGFSLVQAAHIESARKSVESGRTESVWSVELANERFTRQALNSIEQKFYTDNRANAFKFTGSVESSGREYEASVLVVFSSHWKSQHIPEHCYVAQGYGITSSQVLKLGESVVPGHASFRQLQLLKNRTEPGKSPASQSFTSDYWFQSANATTVNYSRRVLSQIKNPSMPWAMVSVLWHDGVPNLVRQQLLSEIQSTVSRNMNSHG